jgi:excisionase family DNA binding protein
VTVRELAKRLEISVSLAYRLVESGKMRCSRHGIGRGVIRISEQQLADYLTSVEQGVRTERVETSNRRVKLKHLRL